MKIGLDLERRSCHVCGSPLRKDLVREKEWCTGRKCLLLMHEFNIPYKEIRGEPLSAYEAV